MNAFKKLKRAIQNTCCIVDQEDVYDTERNQQRVMTSDQQISQQNQPNQRFVSQNNIMSSRVRPYDIPNQEEEEAEYDEEEGGDDESSLNYDHDDSTAQPHYYEPMNANDIDYHFMNAIGSYEPTTQKSLSTSPWEDAKSVTSEDPWKTNLFQQKTTI